MITKNRMNLIFLSVALLFGSAQADLVKFCQQGADDNWTNANNWINCTNSATGVPRDSDEVRINTGVVTLTSAVTVSYLKVGCGGQGKLIIDGGSLVTVGTVMYNSADYDKGGSMIVQNGGSATFNNRFLVGFSNAPRGSLTLRDGTIRVNNTYYHNIDYTGTDVLNTRTTIYTGGLLDVNDLVLNAGVMDVAGGTVIIRQGTLEQVNDWVKEGRIMAMGGVDGWIIKATVDEETGFLKIVAEAESIVLGMLIPVLQDKSVRDS